MTTIAQPKLVEPAVEKPKTATHAIRINQTTISQKAMLATTIVNADRQTTTTAANDPLVVDGAEAADDRAQVATTTAEIRKTKATQAGQTVVAEGDADEAAETTRKAITLKVTKTGTPETKAATMAVAATANDTVIR